MADTADIVRPPVIDTVRLRLIVLLAEEIEALIVSKSTRAGRSVGAAFPPGWPHEREAREGLPWHLRHLRADPHHIPWRIRVIFERASKSVVGSINLKGPPDATGAVEMGWGLIEEHRGRGYAFEAARAVVQWIRTEQGVRSVSATVPSDNARSRLLAAKLGMAYTGELRRGCRCGRWTCTLIGPSRLDAKGDSPHGASCRSAKLSEAAGCPRRHGAGGQAARARQCRDAVMRFGKNLLLHWRGIEPRPAEARRRGRAAERNAAISYPTAVVRFRAESAFYRSREGCALRLIWLEGRDSSPDNVVQSHTFGLAKWPTIISQMAEPARKTTTRHTRRVTAKVSTARVKRSGLDRFRQFLETGSPGPNSHVVLLGLETFDSPKLLRSVERGLPYAAFERLVANTMLPSDDALELVSIPQRTLTRRKREGRFHQDESDRLVRASRVFARALSLFEGDRDAAKHWLLQRHQALGGEAPLALARTEVGALEVERLIGRLEHGVFT